MINVFRYKAVTGSMTQALNASELLSKALIRSTVVKISSGHKRNGCIYGIEFAPEQYNNVRMLLQKYGVQVYEFITDEK